MVWGQVEIKNGRWNHKIYSIIIDYTWALVICYHQRSLKISRGHIKTTRQMNDQYMTSQRKIYKKCIGLFFSLYQFHGHYILLYNGYIVVKNDFQSQIIVEFIYISIGPNEKCFSFWGK